jgi:hypothetical protein
MKKLTECYEDSSSYIPPRVEVLSIVVEQGFAATTSYEDDSNDPFDGPTDADLGWE